MPSLGDHGGAGTETTSPLSGSLPGGHASGHAWDSAAILREGIQVIDAHGEFAGLERPRHDPYSFGINTHVWTSNSIRWRFVATLAPSADHLISRSRQRALVRSALGVWEKEIGRSLDLSEGWPLRLVDVVVRVGWGSPEFDPGQIARGQYPRGVRDYQHAQDVDDKLWLKWNGDASVIDREAALHAFWGELPAAAWGGLVGAVAYSIALLVVLRTHSSYREVATHEIGHNLGLGHSPRHGAMMLPHVQRGQEHLDENDRRAIRSLYPWRVAVPFENQQTQAQAYTMGIDPSGAGTDSVVVDLGTPRRGLLAWTTIGYQYSLSDFDDDNTVAAEVFAVGGRPSQDFQEYEYELDSGNATLEAERRRQLTHEYDSLKNQSASFREYLRRAPFRLGFHNGRFNADPHNATALYYGYVGGVRGSTVQFRAISNHPSDHQMFATGIVLMLPDEQEELEILGVEPPTPPPPPPELPKTEKPGGGNGGIWWVPTDFAPGQPPSPLQLVGAVPAEPPPPPNPTFTARGPDDGDGPASGGLGLGAPGAGAPGQTPEPCHCSPQRCAQRCAEAVPGRKPPAQPPPRQRRWPEPVPVDDVLSSALLQRHSFRVAQTRRIGLDREADEQRARMEELAGRRPRAADPLPPPDVRRTR